MTERVRGKILDRLGTSYETYAPDGRRVFYINKISDDRFVVVEACDEYFSEQLSRDELRELGQEILSAANA